MSQQLLLNTSHILIDGLFDSVPILLSFMAIAFNTGEKETGIIISLAIMVSTLLGLTTVFLSRRLGVSHTLSLIILLYGIGFFFNAFSNNIYLAGACFIIAVAGFSVYHNIAFSYLAANTDRHSLGKAMGNFTAIGDIGRVPFVSLAAFIATFSIFGFSGWQTVCLLYGLGAIVCAGYIFLSSCYNQDKKQKAPLKIAESKRIFPSFSLLYKREYALPICANVLDSFGSDQIFIFLPYLLFAKGIDPTIIGSFAFAFTFGCFLGKIICGRMTDLFGTRKVFIMSEVIMAALLMLLVIEQQVYIIIAASLLLGIVTKGTIPVIQTIITEPAKEKCQYADIFAISTFFRGVTNIVTPLLFGFVASALNIYWIYYLMAAAAIAAIIPVSLKDSRKT